MPCLPLIAWMPRPAPPQPPLSPPAAPPIPCAAIAAPSPTGPLGCTCATAAAWKPDRWRTAWRYSSIVDHLARPQDGGWVQLLPPALDTALVDAGVKANLGALSYNTVRHRLAVLAKWHALKNWPSPTESAAVKTLLREARKAQARQGVSVRKKTAALREPLEAMLATCSDGVRGLRDRALLLLAWSGGGRRRSEVVGLQVGDVRQLDAETWVYALGATKTETEGVRRELPLRGPAAQALAAWLAAAPASTGPLFRRTYRGGRVSVDGLSGDQVARIVQRRAQLAGLDGDWAAHSLRSGFVSEAGRQGVPLGEVMAMTEHRSIPTVMGYFQAGTLLRSHATRLLAPAPSPPADPESPGSKC